MRYLSTLLALTAVACSSPADSAKVVREGRVIFEMSVWSRPNDNSSIIGKLERQDKVSIIDWKPKSRIESGWTAVRFGEDNDVGFVETRGITPARLAQPVQPVKEQVAVHENPGSQFKTIRILSRKDSVDRVGTFTVDKTKSTKEEWAIICAKDGLRGFVLAQELKPLNR